jgi:hypothetical protein
MKIEHGKLKNICPYRWGYGEKSFPYFGPATINGNTFMLSVKTYNTIRITMLLIEILGCL